MKPSQRRALAPAIEILERKVTPPAEGSPGETDDVTDFLDDLFGDGPEEDPKTKEKRASLERELAGYDDRIRKNEEAAEDWASRKYKKTREKIEVGEDANFTPTEINEMRRSRRIRELAKESKELKGERAVLELELADLD